MFYTITHTTSFDYSVPISESMMEVRMQPRNEANQRNLRFQLQTSPHARIRSHRDYLGNTVHHFNVPGSHSKLRIAAEATVDLTPRAPLPEALTLDTWNEIDALTSNGDHWDMLIPSDFARPSQLLREFARSIDLGRQGDPLTLLRSITTIIHQSFAYEKGSTRVDSPIDDALRARSGVCQDFTHIMIALVREVRIPCRYVSGYLFHRVEDHDRSSADATHAWVEALLPQLGWVGFDPTNNLVVSDRHIRTAVGRDYADVPPTRGVFKGRAKTELKVAVRVVPSAEPPLDDDLPPLAPWTTTLDEDDQQQQQ